MEIGSLVQALDYQGQPLEDWIGTVLSFTQKGRVRVHWFTHSNPRGAIVQSDPALHRGLQEALHGWGRGRLKVLA